MTPAALPAWRREGVWAAVAAAMFAAVCVLLHWPLHPLVAALLVGVVWGVSLLLRRHGRLTGIDGVDCLILGVLVGAALLVRLASPIYLDFLQGSLDGVGQVAAPAGVHRSPTHQILGIGAWGLGYPYDRQGCTQVPVGREQAEVKRCGFVFDEVYFPVDALKDLKGIDYFDPEPPLSKLIIATGISWLGFDPWGWRIMSAIFGSLLVGLLYLLARRLWHRYRWFAILAALFLSLDGLELVESRTGVIDIFAAFFVVLGFWLFLLHWHARSRKEWLWTLYLLGLGSGLGLATKADMIPPLLLMGLLLLARWVRPHLRLRGLGQAGPRWLLPPAPDDPAEAGRRTMVGSMRWGWHYLGALVLILVVFYLSFFRYWTISHSLYVNFADTGRGSAACTSLTTKASVCQLPVAMGISEHKLGPMRIWLPDSFNLGQSLVDVEMNSLAALSYQATLKATHPFASPYYTWPLDGHPVLFYATYTGNGVSSVGGETVANYSWIDDMGNPAIFWMGLLALALCLYWTVRRRDRIALFILLGFLFDWLVLWSWPSRILFFYEFLESLPFTCLALSYVCVRLLRTRWSLQLGAVRLGAVGLRPLAGAVVLAVVLSFAYFYPLWTGQPINSSSFFQHIWIPGWY